MEREERLRQYLEQMHKTVEGSALLFVGEDSDQRNEWIEWYLDLFSEAERVVIEPTVDKDSISVEQVRDVRAQLGRSSLNAQTRLVICPHAELLTTQAGNALLKHIEEPPPATHWILGCNNEEDVISTIVSRCRKISVTSFDGKARGRSDEEYAVWLSSLDAPLWKRLIELNEPPLEVFIHRAFREYGRSTISLSVLLSMTDRIREIRASHALESSRSAADRVILGYE